MNKEDAFKDLMEVKQALDSLGIRWFLTYGAVLGAIREKDFIAHDDDLDLTIVDPLTYKQRKEIGWLLQDIGFTNQEDMLWNIMGRWEKPSVGWDGKGETCTYNGTEETGIIVAKKRVPVSIFFFKSEGDNYLLIPLPYAIPLLETPKKFYEKGEWIKFKGEKFLIPSPVKEYFEYTYGKDWRTPKEGAHATQYAKQHDLKEIAKKYWEL